VLVDYSEGDGLLAGGRGAEGSCAAGWRTTTTRPCSEARDVRLAAAKVEGRARAACGFAARPVQAYGPKLGGRSQILQSGTSRVRPALTTEVAEAGLGHTRQGVK
jgi:hypothetical protein